MDVDRHEVTLDGLPVDLTPTEFGLLRALMQQPGRAFTRHELVESVGDVAYEGLERTIDSHVKNLRKKVESDPRNPARIRTVYGVGYRLQADA
jgi:two-component system alkaline phosphatase synthesis response regulator PhoP